METTVTLNLLGEAGEIGAALAKIGAALNTTVQHTGTVVPGRDVSNIPDIPDIPDGTDKEPMPEEPALKPKNPPRKKPAVAEEPPPDAAAELPLIVTAALDAGYGAKEGEDDNAYLARLQKVASVKSKLVGTVAVKAAISKVLGAQSMRQATDSDNKVLLPAVEAALDALSDKP